MLRIADQLITRDFFHRLNLYLQGKNINRVACGSAHTLAWSTNKSVSSGLLPQSIPMECDLLKDIPIVVLRNRLVSKNMQL